MSKLMVELPEHQPVWNGCDELPACRYDCRKTCENINMLDLLFDRHAKDEYLDKGAQIRSCYWMLNDLWAKGMTIEDVRYAIQTGATLVQAKNIRVQNRNEDSHNLERVMDDLQRMLEDLRGINGRQESMDNRGN